MQELIKLGITKPKRYYDGKGYIMYLVGETPDGRKITIDDEVIYRGNYASDGKLARRSEDIRYGNDYSYKMVDQSSNKSNDKYYYLVIRAEDGRQVGKFKNEKDARLWGEDYCKGDYQLQKFKVKEFVESKLLGEHEYEHTGDNEVDYTLDCNLDDGNHEEFKKWLKEKDLLEDYTYEKDGKLMFEGDVELQFEVDVEDSDEYIESWNAIMFEGENIKDMVKSDISTIEKYLDENYLTGYSYNDWINELRSDYYHSVL